MNLSSKFQDYVVKVIVLANKELDEARRSGIDDDCEYIGYREGLVDAYTRVLSELYTMQDIDSMLETMSEWIKEEAK